MKNNKNSPNYTSAYCLLLDAIWNLWPEVKFGLIELLDDGFFCDLDISKINISEKDFPKIEKLMTKLQSDKDKSLADISLAEAKGLLSKQKQDYLLESLEDKQDSDLKLYRHQDFEAIIFSQETKLQSDFVFKIVKIGGAYWLNKADQAQLQRLQVVVFAKQKQLDAYLKKQSETAMLDHRQIGKDQNLFMFSDLVGSGLPLWLEDGATLRRQLENFIVDEEIKRGYKHVMTPDIASLKLYETSGHYPYYKDDMYAPIDIDGKKFMLRPMTCPHHFQIYNNDLRSYRELPIRYAELAKLYRYEQSGELSGLTRVRSFTLADAHIFCRPDQVNDEIEGALQLIEDVASVFKLVKNKDYFYRLSLGDKDNKDKYYDDAKAWSEAESKLRSVLKARKDKFTEVSGEAAFYGPKIDVQMFNNNGKEETAFTVQYDFVMPKRFKLTYKDADQKTQEAVAIHRSSIGAIERIIAFLIEFYKGRFPVWLSPTQIKVLTVSNSQEVSDYVNFLKVQAINNNVRVKIDNSQNSIGKKIRQSQLELVPYTIVVGEKEVKTDELNVSIRSDLDQAALASDITYSFSEILQGVLIDIDAKT